MPELPDVEHFRRYLGSTALHRRITGVKASAARVLEGVSRRRLEKDLTGDSLEAASRHGKYLFAELDSGRYLVLHFGMTGFLTYFKDIDRRPEHERLLLSLENGYHLAYDNQRLLGTISLTEDRERFIAEQELGPDALAVDFQEFASRLGRGRGAVKSTLMNQSVLAGLGNVYTDEILFQARLHPKAPVGKLTEEELHSLFDTMREVLKKAIKAQADPQRMPDDFLLPHRGDHNSCPRCGETVLKITISGRSSYLCPACQRMPGRKSRRQ